MFRYGIYEKFVQSTDHLALWGKVGIHVAGHINNSNSLLKNQSLKTENRIGFRNCRKLMENLPSSIFLTKPTPIKASRETSCNSCRRTKMYSLMKYEPTFVSQELQFQNLFQLLFELFVLSVLYKFLSLKIWTLSFLTKCFCPKQVEEKKTKNKNKPFNFRNWRYFDIIRSFRK